MTNHSIKEILTNQRQHSDKDIFNILNALIEKILNEKINLGQKDNSSFCWNWRHRYERISSNNEKYGI